MLLLNVYSIFLHDDVWFWRIQNEFIFKIRENANDIDEKLRHAVYTSDANLMIMIVIRM